MAQNGKDILIKVAGTLVYCSTSCSLSINQESIDANCKSSGYWANSIDGRASWSATVDGLYQTDTSQGFVELSAYITNSSVTNLVEVIIGDTESVDNDDVWTGNARISDISLTGDDNAVATWSCSLTGIGELVHSDS